MTTKFKSGTETVYAESNWHYSLGEAENECIREIEREIEETIDELERQGKKVIGSTHYSLTTDEREDNDTIEYKCSARSDINWIEVEISLNKGLFNSNKALSSRFVVLEDELLARFASNFPRPDRYHSMSLSKISIVEADVRVQEKLSSLPNSMTEETYVLNNNTNNEQTKNVRLTLSTVEGERFTYTKNVTTQDEIKFGLSYEIKGLKADGSVRQTWTTQIGKSEERQITRTRTYQEDFQQKIGPMKSLIIRIKREILNEVYKLEGYILFDGDVNIKLRWKNMRSCGPFGTDRCAEWKEQDYTVKFSQFLSEEQRKITLDGQVTISSSENTRTTTEYSEVDLPTSNSIDLKSIDTTMEGMLEGQEYLLLKNLPEGIKFIQK